MSRQHHSEPHFEDGINWQQQLSQLPVPVRAVIVWSRLAGIWVIFALLIGAYFAKDVGLMDDQASKDRRELLSVSANNRRMLEESLQAMDRQLHAFSEHASNTAAIARNTCLLIPNLTEIDRRQCVGLIR